MFNWRELPLVRFLMPFIGGIALALYLNANLPVFFWLLFLVFIFVFSISLFRGLYHYRWLFGFGLSALLFLLGYQLTWHFNELNQSEHFKNKWDESSFLIGVIDEMPSAKNRIKIILKAQSVGKSTDSLSTCLGDVLCYLDKDSLSELLTYGDRILIRGNIFPVPSSKNPEAFNYKKYLYYKNIHYQAFIKSENWQLLDNGNGNPILAYASRLRSKFISVLKKHLPGENEFAVASALILGHKEELSPEIRTAYANTGAMHILAVSGLHVGLIYLIVNLLLSMLGGSHWLWKVGKTFLLIFSVWSFAILTGLSPSVQRAATMFSFIILARSLYRFTNIYNTLAASAFFLLVFNPFLIMSVGFQLSYLAVVGIVFFQPRIVKLWHVKNKIGNYFWQLTGVSIAAQIMTLPIGIFYFHQFPIYFWLSGLIVIPAAAIILGSGILLFLLDAVIPGLSHFAGIALYKIIWAVNTFIFQIQSLPGSVISGISVGFIIVLFLYLMIGQIMVALKTFRFSWLVSALAFLFFIGFTTSFSKLENHQNRQIVIYSIYKNSAIDFMNGNKVYSFTNEEMTEKSLEYAVQNYRWSKGIKTEKPFSFSSASLELDNCLFWKDNFVQFYNKRLAIVDRDLRSTLAKKIVVDYVLIRNNPKISLDNIIQMFDFETIIFDASNSKWKVEMWKEESNQLGISFYDVNELGALIIDVTK